MLTTPPDRRALLREGRRALAGVLGASTGAAISRWRSKNSASGQSGDSMSIRLVAASASGPFSAMASASPRAVPGPSPGSASRLTSPSSKPRSASIGSPVSASSMATLRGSTRGRRSSAPPAATSERLTSGMPSLAPRAATIRSQASATSRPPATAKPSTAAISGLAEARWVIPAKPAVSRVGTLAGHERLEIHAGAEALAGPGEHAERQPGVGVELVQRGGDPLGDRGVDRVALVGPVDRDHEDPVAALGQDGSVALMRVSLSVGCV